MYKDGLLWVSANIGVKHLSNVRNCPEAGAHVTAKPRVTFIIEVARSRLERSRKVRVKLSILRKPAGLSWLLVGDLTR